MYFGKQSIKTFVLLRKSFILCIMYIIIIEYVWDGSFNIMYK